MLAPMALPVAIVSLIAASSRRRAFGKNRRDGIDDGVIPGASAHIAGEIIADLLARARPALRHQFVRGKQHARGAEAALRGVEFDEGLLQLREGSLPRQALDRIDALAIHLRCERQAAARGAAVDEHGAGTADAVLTAQMRAGQLELLAK